MKISTNYILKKMLAWCWLAAIVGAVFAGGYYILRKAKAAEPLSEVGAASAVSDAMPLLYEDPADDPEMYRFALYTIGFSDFKEALPGGVTADVYINTMDSVAVAKYLSFSALYKYYDDIMNRYPALDQYLFTYSVMRPMISLWEDKYTLVLRISAPEIEEGQLAGYAVALGYARNADELDGYSTDEREALMAQIKCALRDDIFGFVTEYMESGGVFPEGEITLSRTDYTQWMSYQSIAARRSEAGEAWGESGAEQGTGLLGMASLKKSLAILFLLGFALVEGIVFALTLLDDTIHSARDFEANTSLPVLAETELNAPELCEAALKLSTHPAEELVLLGFADDPASLEQISEALSRAVREVNEQGSDPGEKTMQIHIPVLPFNGKWDASMAKLIGRKTILVVDTGKTKIRDLQLTAKMLGELRVEALGAIVTQK